MIDPAGNTTTWTRDLQGRIIAKSLADGAQTLYEYERSTSRLSRITDPNGNTANGTQLARSQLLKTYFLFLEIWHKAEIHQLTGRVA